MRTCGSPGSYQSDFARNYAREGLDISDMVAEAVTGTLEPAGLPAGDVDAVHVGNAFGQLFTGQGQLGAMPATVEPGAVGKPAARHEAACASGSVAVLAAMADIEAGRYDCALVSASSRSGTCPAISPRAHLGAAAWVGHEGQDAKFLWPYMFSRAGRRVRPALRPGRRAPARHRRAQHAQRQGQPATRRPAAGRSAAGGFAADDDDNPVVEGRLRRTDCSQITDGAAGVLLVSDRFRADQAQTSQATAVAIAGWGHRTAGLPLQPKLERSQGQPYVFPHVRPGRSPTRSAAPGIDDVGALDGIETHDCFTMSEYMAIDHFGITAPGESWKAVENGELDRDGAIPVNPSGGLIGVGHPVGATGVRMLLDAARQVTGQAGEYQVDGRRDRSPRSTSAAA